MLLPKLNVNPPYLSVNDLCYDESTASRDSVDIDRLRWTHPDPEFQSGDETTRLEIPEGGPKRSSSTYYSTSEPLSVVENDYSSIKNYKEFQATFHDLFRDHEGIVDDDSWDGSQGGDDSTCQDRQGLILTVRKDVKSGAEYLWGLTKQSFTEFREVDDKFCLGRLLKMWNSIPFVKTMQAYKKKFLLKDMSAGITEGIMNIPLGKWIINSCSIFSFTAAMAFFFFKIRPLFGLQACPTLVWQMSLQYMASTRGLFHPLCKVSSK